MGKSNKKISSILEPFFSKYDLSNLSEDDKKTLIREVSQFIAFISLDLFNALDLKSHIECMVINDANKKEYILSFKTVEKFINDKAEMPRPEIKNFFPENTTLTDIIKTYDSQPELFNYTKALDRFIDHIEIDNWIDVTYKLPETNIRVIVTDGNYVGQAYRRKSDGKWQGWHTLDNEYCSVIRKWIPFPSAPLKL